MRFIFFVNAQQEVFSLEKYEVKLCRLQIVNNNIVISEDKNHKEVVLMGKGLGFQKHKGDEIKLSQIEKTYVMKDHGMTQRFQEMLLIFRSRE